MIEHSDYDNKNNDSSDDANSNIEKVGDSSWEQCQWNRTKPADFKHTETTHITPCPQVHCIPVTLTEGTGAHSKWHRETKLQQSDSSAYRQKLAMLLQS